MVMFICFDVLGQLNIWYKSIIDIPFLPVIVNITLRPGEEADLPDHHCKMCILFLTKLNERESS